MIEALIFALIAIWLIAALQIGAIEREHADLGAAMTKLRLQRRRELRESIEARRHDTRRRDP